MPRELWSGRSGFILAAIGAAIGLGNIWRFGYIVYSNGGGAFLIPYFVALFTVGISLLILELTIGHRFRGSTPNSFKRARRSFEWIGWWAVLGGFILIMYYVVIIAWSLIYVFKSFTLAWGEDPNSYFFGSVLELSSTPWDLGGFPSAVLVALITIWAINWFIVAKGVRKGIERANKIFMPLLWLLAIILVVRALTLPGSMAGIDWYLKPDFTRLADYSVWLAAYGQIFFSLSLGWGVMTVYASYLPEKSDIVNNAFIVSLANCAFSFLLGFAVFGTLGYMASTTNQEIGSVVDISIGLAFVVFPKALSLLPGLNVFTGVVFFSCLVIAGLATSISVFEAFVTGLMDKFKMPRSKAVNITFVMGLLGSLLFATRGGLYWLDIVDHFINIYGLILVGLLEALAIGWILGAEKVRNWANRNSEIKAGIWWDLSIKVITPLILALLIALDIKSNLQSPYEGYPVSALGIGMAILLAGMILATILSLIKEDTE
jgi:NSS family neurotransmitter:Na+ symporter